MRRSPLVSLLVFSFLGLSGCAGVSRRLDWSSPSTPRADADETPAPGRVSWWRRPRAEAPTSDSAGDLALFYRAGPSPIATKVPGDVWPEPKTNWQVRYFPHLSRLWNGNAPGNASDPEPISDVGHVSSRYRPPAASQSGRSDDDVRPVDASADDDIASRERSTVAEKRERFAPPLVLSPLLGRSPTHSQPDGTSDVELDTSKVDPGRVRSARSEALETPTNQREWASSSTIESTPVVATASGEESPSETSDKTSVVTESGLASEAIAKSAPEPAPDTELAQAPAAPAPNTQPPATIPPPPPLNRTPPPPSLTDEKPVAKPEQPEASTAPKDEAQPDRAPDTKPQPAPVAPVAEVPPTSASSAPSVPPSAAAAPASTQRTQAQSPAPGRRLVYASDQAIYASPPPMAPPRPRHKFLSLFFGEEKKVPLASPQLPAATFPTTYYGTFPRPYPVLAATQANDVKPHVATRPAKKPCVLTVWFQRITSGGHGCCCAGCRHACATPSCSGCTCNGENNKSVGAPPQTSLASPQADLPSRQSPLSQTVPIDSTGPKPGDVTEEGKLFERVSFESFDKSPQS